MKKHYIITSFIILIVLILISFGVYKKNNIEYLSVIKGDVAEAIYGLGKVKSDQIFEVKIGIMMGIKKINFKEGDYAQKGQSLIEFEDSIEFKAPFNGTVTSLNFQEGEIALPQVQILRLEDLDKKYIEVSLEQDAALKVKKGLGAQIIFESLSTEKLSGVVQNIYPKDNEFLARIEVENFQRKILPGMTADVVIKIGNIENVILIPVKAIVDGKVIRYRNEKKDKIEVKIGHSDGAWAQLTEGDIKIGDQVIVKGK